MKKLLIAATLGAGFVMSGVASAGPLLTTPETLTFNFNTLNDNTSLSFAGFNASLGTLNSVHFTWLMNKTLNNVVLNNTLTTQSVGSPTPLTATSTTTFTGTGAGINLSSIDTLTTPGFVGTLVAGTDFGFVFPGLIGPSSTLVGSATVAELTGGSCLSNDASCGVGSSDLSAYIGGASLFNIGITNTGSQGGSVPDGVFTGNTGTASGSVTIQYDYTAATSVSVPVPEPTSMALMGLGSLLLGFQTSRKRKQG
ncbi:MAG: choice-of-anchor E domain-containing protein [Methylococcaceae bacterium]|nr:choice-of-anchor E domain-containing protein [Methylococcaceae bacterium]